MAHTPAKGRRRQTAKKGTPAREGPPPEAQAAKVQEPQIPGLQAPDQATVAASNTITTFELRSNLGKVLDSVRYQGASYTVTNYGAPVAYLTGTETGWNVQLAEPLRFEVPAETAADPHIAVAPAIRPTPKRTRQEAIDELLHGVNRSSKG